MRISGILSSMKGDPTADRILPPTGFTAYPTVFTATTMAFLGVFALALSLASGRLADRWEASLAQSSTVRISAPAEQRQTQTDAVLRVLGETPGIASFRALTDEEQRALLVPWFGPELPVDTLPIPQLVEIVEDRRGFYAEGLRLRLQAEAPGALLDDHTRWRQPLVRAAERLNMLALGAMTLIVLTMGAMITLAASAALSANRQVMAVLRLVGVRDTYVARAFVRRFTLRAALGAGIGTIVAMLAVALMPRTDAVGGFLTDWPSRGPRGCCPC